MQFIGIDLHTNRFTCCYRTERSSLTNGKDKRTETFDLTGPGLAAFYRTLTGDTNTSTSVRGTNKEGLVRTGLRRRILTEIYQMLKKGEYHYGRDAAKHGAKMAAYKKFLESQTFLKKSA